MSEFGNLTVDLAGECEEVRDVKKDRSWLALGAGYAAAAGIGAAAMFFFDPSRGKARRALCRDKTVSLYRKGQILVHKRVEDLENRIHGIEMEIRARIEGDAPYDDDKLAARVRARLGRLTTHAHPIEVYVKDGTVDLKGRVVVDEVDRIITGLRAMPGVKSVVNHMAMFEASEAAR